MTSWDTCLRAVRCTSAATVCESAGRVWGHRHESAGTVCRSAGRAWGARQRVRAQARCVGAQAECEGAD
eukprot:366477-Chlamydomonas_euryale.AAC.5